MRHFDLTAPGPASAQVALLFNGQVEWETTLVIPGDAQVLHPQWRAKHALRTGDAIGFHLHNHGQNTWTLASVQKLP